MLRQRIIPIDQVQRHCQLFLIIQSRLAKDFRLLCYFTFTFQSPYQFSQHLQPSTQSHYYRHLNRYHFVNLQFRSILLHAHLFILPLVFF